VVVPAARQPHQRPVRQIPAAAAAPRRRELRDYGTARRSCDLGVRADPLSIIRRDRRPRRLMARGCRDPAIDRIPPREHPRFPRARHRRAGGPAPASRSSSAYSARCARMRRGAERVFSTSAPASRSPWSPALRLPAALRMGAELAAELDGFLLLGCWWKGRPTTTPSSATPSAMVSRPSRRRPARGRLRPVTVDSLAQAEARSRDDRRTPGAKAAHA